MVVNHYAGGRVCDGGALRSVDGAAQVILAGTLWFCWPPPAPLFAVLLGAAMLGFTALISNCPS